MGSLSLTHILVIVIIAAILMGPQRLPELGKSVGKAIKGFKSGLNDADEKVALDSRDPSTQKRESDSQKS